MASNEQQQQQQQQQRFRSLLPGLFSPHSELPAGLDLGSPHALFSHVVTDPVFKYFSDSINEYADYKRSKSSKIRSWQTTTVSEIKVFFGVILYMSVPEFPTISSLWRSEPRPGPDDHMSHERFEQIQRFAHISVPGGDSDRTESGSEDDTSWRETIAPLAALFEEAAMHFEESAAKIFMSGAMTRRFGHSSQNFQLQCKR
ncbi:hypothetical protein N7539_004330 [Penicillium diatomitis]|uniref:PiggyBac transposable element-derived protein domain-containing protein n=1 Tax=Penicillium diatomitis TaxID=2819901 RepID=A0A9W9XDM3_9EURO|nr:uncharacterized protein N7539_004330 [Penicillium diatomitis]KAJ5489440.1 hypothetical protein N7539_004330 [Penicillium diatomitis]